MSFSLLSKHFTILFGASFFLLTLHILDDAFVVNEAAWYGITTQECLFACMLLYCIAPPYALWLARSNSGGGFAILTFYALQAFYGAGLNPIRHLLSNFRGSQLLPNLLNS